MKIHLIFYNCFSCHALIFLVLLLVLFRVSWFCQNFLNSKELGHVLKFATLNHPHFAPVILMVDAVWRQMIRSKLVIISSGWTIVFTTRALHGFHFWLTHTSRSHHIAIIDQGGMCTLQVNIMVYPHAPFAPPPYLLWIIGVIFLSALLAPVKKWQVFVLYNARSSIAESLKEFVAF